MWVRLFKLNTPKYNLIQFAPEFPFENDHTTGCDLLCLRLLRRRPLWSPVSWTARRTQVSTVAFDIMLRLRISIDRSLQPVFKQLKINFQRRHDLPCSSKSQLCGKWPVCKPHTRWDWRWTESWFYRFWRQVCKSGQIGEQGVTFEKVKALPSTMLSTLLILMIRPGGQK